MVPMWLKKFQNGAASFSDLFSSYLAQSSYLVWNRYAVFLFLVNLKCSLLLSSGRPWPYFFSQRSIFQQKMWFKSKLAGLPVKAHCVSCRWNLKLAFLNVGPALTAQLRGGSIRIEPSRQLLDDCTHKRNNKRKVGKPIHH